MRPIDKYLKYLDEFGMPAMGIMPARRPAGYKQLGVHPSSAVNVSDEEDEDLEEYTSFSTSGNGYGMMLQRWNLSGSGALGPNEPYVGNPSADRELVNKITSRLKKVKTKKENDDEED